MYIVGQNELNQAIYWDKVLSADIPSALFYKAFSCLSLGHWMYCKSSVIKEGNFRC